MSAEQLWDFDKVLMRLWVLSFSWMWPILEKRSEILDKNFISNIWIFQAFEIQKNVQKLTSFVLSNNNSALYIWLCFRTHTRTVQPSCSFVTWRPTLYNFTYVDFFFSHLAPLQLCCACQFSPSLPSANSLPGSRGTDWTRWKHLKWSLMLLVTALCLGWFCH